jgi:hypothetical protein
MKDAEFADEVIRRLNRLVKNDEVAADLRALIAIKVKCSKSTQKHPLIQCSMNRRGKAQVGLLGMLNGIAGRVPTGPRKGWGYVAAMLNDSDELLNFERTDKVLSGKKGKKR